MTANRTQSHTSLPRQRERTFGAARRHSATFGDVITSHQQGVDTHICIRTHTYVLPISHIMTHFVLDACRGESLVMSYDKYEIRQM